MVVLSLFDGMSCGQIALHELGIIPETYYASEIDKFAISQTQLNFPDTIQLGDVAEVDVSRLKPVDLLIGGSPCQSFSFAGKRAGMKTTENEEIYTLDRYLQLKADGFQFEGQSYLFWEYMRILADIRKYNPNVLFLLENVEMGKKWERVLSDAIGLYGVHINSALVSAQNRKRIYWTNIRTRQEGLFGDLHSDIPQPEDKGILLRDILDEDVSEKYFLSDMKIEWLDKHSAKTGNAFHKLTDSDKAYCITSTAEVKNNLSTNYVCVAMRGRNPDNPSDRTSGIHTEQRIEPNMDGKTNCLTSVQKDNLILQRPRGNNKGGEFTEKAPTLTSNHWEQNSLIIESGTLRTQKVDGGFRPVKSGKAGCLCARARNDGSGQGAVRLGNSIRRLTPTECARLQTIPDWYKWQCSETQQYKMLGNGWTVAVISHILQYLKS